MSMKTSVAFLALLSVALAVTACSGGFTQEEVDATASAALEAGYEAGVLDAAEVLDSGPQKAFLEVTFITPNYKRPFSSASACDRPCAQVVWIRGDGSTARSNFYMDSQCVQEVRVGYDLPESCR